MRLPITFIHYDTLEDVLYRNYIMKYININEHTHSKTVNLRLCNIVCRHDISPVFTGIPVFLSCPRSFLWKSQNRFKNLDGFYGGGGGVYLLGDLIDLLLSRLNTLLQCFINPIAYVGYSQFTHCL